MLEKERFLHRGNRLGRQFPHAGGLAYDNNHELLWVTSEKGDTAQVITLSLKDIETYDFADSHGRLPMNSIELPDIKRFNNHGPRR